MWQAGTCMRPNRTLTPPTHHHPLSTKKQARRMLESYEREMESVAGQLEEMRENLDTHRCARPGCLCFGGAPLSHPPFLHAAGEQRRGLAR